MKPGASAGVPAPGAWRFVFVMDGEAEAAGERHKDLDPRDLSRELRIRGDEKGRLECALEGCNRRVGRVRRRGRRRHARRLAAHCAIRGHVATRVEEPRHERRRAQERVSVAGLAADIAVGARVDGSEAGGLA